MSNHQFTRPEGTGGKSILGSDDKTPLNQLGNISVPDASTLTIQVWDNSLVKSIENFVNQEELIELMKNNNFQNCSYRNLSGGIVAIHSGWKI